MRVLIVEDEVAIAKSLERGLTREGIAVDLAFDGEEGLAKLGAAEYDVAVLDRWLPGVSGDDVCHAIVASGSRTRVLMLTASATVDDRVAGLSLGADDYLGKPFAFNELLARLRALYRRAAPAAPPVLTTADLTLDTAKRIVARDGRVIVLPRKEFGLLEVLMMANGQVVSSAKLLERVWNESASGDSAVVRVAMTGLRRKLGPPDLIRTVIGVGYHMSPASHPKWLLPTPTTATTPGGKAISPGRRTRRTSGPAGHGA